MPHNLVGQRYGRLLVIAFAFRDSASNANWLCRCDCGAEKTVRADALRSKKGATLSCGCLAIERSKSRNTTHGAFYTPEYGVYYAARDRCTNPKNGKWKDYGGRGIQFKFKNFEEFLSAIGPKPSADLLLDRINNDGNYEPGNVRWVTIEESNRNRRVFPIGKAKNNK